MSVILSVQEVYKEFSGDKLFQPVSFIVRDHDRVAILGPNGTGKSTLIKMILGQEEKSGGQVLIPKGIRVGYLSQDVIENPENTLYEEALTVFKTVREDEAKMTEAANRLSQDPENPDLLKDYSNKETAFESEGGYDYSYKIAMILNMFSFSKEDYSRKISTFSGGEKTRVAFAKLLLLNPDLLVMDEPTNHLDIISIEWLEDYLSTYSGAVLFVSHDIAFVKKLATSILDIDHQVFTFYHATYDNFAKMKEDNYQALLEQYKAQEEEKEKLKRFITFYMPKPRFASRAHDREKKLARLEENSITDPSAVKTTHISIGLNGAMREGKKLLDFNDVSIGYDKPLVSHIQFTLFGKDHLAVMGANGSGKTTFGKLILNELKPLVGEVRRYFHMTMGVLRQDIRSYQDDETLFNYFRNLYPKMSNEDIYGGLGQYAFSYKEANEKKLSDLSGGELMRIEILHLSLENYDLLLLDEPTNHLDMMSISELVDALNDYEGTLVIISHDRDFVDKTCNKLLYLYHGKSYYYAGPYSEFRDKELITIIHDEKEAIAAQDKAEHEQKKNQQNALRNSYQDLKKKTRQTREAPEKIMEKIDKAEAKKKELTDLCSSPDYYPYPDKMADLASRMATLDSEIQALYDELEKAM
ncbi:MAG: ATP-binding cassette domain-containing protein [Bacilli bacterium]|jgi:ATP-binding cassette subfamily F protein 3|nr:ATP-binding cassette domain-containing protein [Bacilli bacterium]